MEDKIRLRNATMDDAELLFHWRNDPLTRQQSIQQNELSFETHEEWLRTTLQSQTTFLFVAEFSETAKPVGTGRADKEENVYKLSWTIAPNMRGMGIGVKLVKELIHMFENCRAEVKVDNVPSLKIADRAGLKTVKTQDGIIYFST